MSRRQCPSLRSTCQIGKTSKQEACKIFAKHSLTTAKKIITKYKHLLDTKPPKKKHTIKFSFSRIHCCGLHPRQIWQPSYPPQRQLGCYIPLTTHIFSKARPHLPWYHQPYGGLHMCNTSTPMAMHSRSHLHNRCPTPTPIFEQFTRALYDGCLKLLSKGKTPCLDNIPNDILKILPDICHAMLFLFFIQYYLQHSIMDIWKHSTLSTSIKISNPTQLP